MEFTREYKDWDVIKRSNFSEYTRLGALVLNLTHGSFISTVIAKPTAYKIQKVVIETFSNSGQLIGSTSINGIENMEEHVFWSYVLRAAQDHISDFVFGARWIEEFSPYFCRFSGGILYHFTNSLPPESMECDIDANVNLDCSEGFFTCQDHSR